MSKMWSSILLVVISLCIAEGNSIPSKPLACTNEQHRPRFHFSSKRNWINDPNGMVYHEGVYHLYYQHHPESMFWGPMHWGHAISHDLSSWEELPIAIYPDELGTIFSGSAIIDSLNTTGFKRDGSPDPIVAIYTSAGDQQRQSIAYSLDNGLTFTKFEGNPVLSPTETPDFRDPKVGYYGNKWVMSLAVLDRVEFFASADLKSWAKHGEFGRNPPVGNHDGVWECPDLVRFEVDGQEFWVLIVSINPGGPNGGSATQYFIGNFSITDNNLDFSNYPWTENHWMDCGPDNYAGVTFSNEPHGRNIYMGWMTNWMYAGDTPNLSHRGQMTIPRQLGIRSFGNNNFRLTSNPVPELENLRDPEQHLVKPEEFQVPPQTVIELTAFANFTTPLMELEINLELANNPQFSICAHNNMDEEVCVGFNNTKWYLDRSKSGNVGFSDNFRNALVATAPREISEGKTNIRIFLDVSSIEVFVDDGLATFTALHFPSEPFNKFYLNHWSEPNGLAVVDVKGFSIWGLKCWFESD